MRTLHILKPLVGLDGGRWIVFVLGLYFVAGGVFIVNLPATQVSASAPAEISAEIQVAQLTPKHTSHTRGVRDDAPLLLVALSSRTPIKKSETRAPLTSKRTHVAKGFPYAPRAPGVREVKLRIKRGQNLNRLLGAMGVSHTAIRRATKALSAHMDLRRIQIGQRVTLSFARHGSKVFLDTLRIPVSNALSEAVVRRTKGGTSYRARIVPRLIETRYAQISGEIQSSFFVSAKRAGLPVPVIMQALGIYAHAVDFQRDLRRGDRFEILYAHHIDAQGRSAGDVHILHASLSVRSGKKTHEIWRHTREENIESTDNAENAGIIKAAHYFYADGRSIHGFLMKTPVNGARISGTYGMRRHPVLGYSRMHKGVDFAAPTRTPIYAAGNGTIEEVGAKGNYGNYVRIRHDNSFKSAYAHMSGFAPGIKPGVRVKQGDTIGYVGSTGLSTGPHLHYEVLRHNKHVNPMRVKLPPSPRLAKKEMPEFRKAQRISARIAEALVRQAIRYARRGF